MTAYGYPMTTANEASVPLTPFDARSPGILSQSRFWMGSAYSAGGGEYGAITGRSPYTPISSGYTPRSLTPNVMSWTNAVGQYHPVPQLANFPPAPLPTWAQSDAGSTPGALLRPSSSNLSPHRVPAPLDTERVDTAPIVTSTTVVSATVLEGHRTSASPSPVYHSVNVRPSLKRILGRVSCLLDRPRIVQSLEVTRIGLSGSAWAT